MSSSKIQKSPLWQNLKAACVFSSAVIKLPVKDLLIKPLKFKASIDLAFAISVKVSLEGSLTHNWPKE